MSRESATAEAALVGVPCTMLASQLCSSGFITEATALLTLWVLATALGARTSAAIPAPGIHTCSFRGGASAGLALGCCTPSLVVGAKMLLSAHSAAPTSAASLRQLYWSAIGCALQPLCALLRKGSPLPAGPGARLTGLTLGALPTYMLLGRSAATLAAAAILTHAAALDASVSHVHGCFTTGEAVTLAQGVALLAVDAALITTCECRVGAAGVPACVKRSRPALAAEAVFGGGTALALTLALALALVPQRGLPLVRSLLFSGGAAIGLGVVLLPWLSALLNEDALHWLANTVSGTGRSLMIAYWAATALVGSVVAARLAPPVASAAVASGLPAAPACARLLAARKLYHALIVAIFAPGLVLQPALLRLACSAALPTFALLEVVRAHALPPLGCRIRHFLARFVDSRDAGMLVLTHIYLLLGCALPVLLGAAALPCAPATAPSLAAAVPFLAAAPHAGLLVLGVGDAVASLVGMRAGRMYWSGGRKTVEGTAAAVVALLLAQAALLRPNRAAVPVPTGAQWVALASCTVLVLLLEAATSQIDNLFLPLYYYVLLLLLASAELRVA